MSKCYTTPMKTLQNPLSNNDMTYNQFIHIEIKIDIFASSLVLTIDDCKTTRIINTIVSTQVIRLTCSRIQFMILDSLLLLKLQMKIAMCLRLLVQIMIRLLHAMSMQNNKIILHILIKCK